MRPAHGLEGVNAVDGEPVEHTFIAQRIAAIKCFRPIGSGNSIRPTRLTLWVIRCARKPKSPQASWSWGVVRGSA